VILKFYREVNFADTEACQGLHLFPLCDVMISGVLLKWRWVYAEGRGEAPEGTLLIYDH